MVQQAAGKFQHQIPRRLGIDQPTAKRPSFARRGSGLAALAERVAEVAGGAFTAGP